MIEEKEENGERELRKGFRAFYQKRKRKLFTVISSKSRR